MNGSREEDLALHYLQSQGLALVERNVRARGGELDLVMRDRDATLVIVEVRKRTHRAFGSAAESVDARKQRRIVQAARSLLVRRPELARLAARFDVVTLDGEDRIDWIQAAFEASD